MLEQVEKYFLRNLKSENQFFPSYRYKANFIWIIKSVNMKVFRVSDFKIGPIGVFINTQNEQYQCQLCISIYLYHIILANKMPVGTRELHFIHLSRNCLFECIISLQCYGFISRCSPLLLILVSSLTFAVYP